MMTPMATRLDSLIARGNTSDVFRWGNDSVVKILRPGIPDEWARREAHTTQLVHAAGLPAPEVLDLTTVQGRPALVLERVDGVPMWDHMLTEPADIPRLAILLAELQTEINLTPAPSGMPRLVDRLSAKIADAAPLSPIDRDDAQRELARLPEANALCHFDVHPNNVIMGPQGPIIVDWYDAAAGNPAADVVRSSTLMRRDAATCHLPCADPSVVAVVHDQYLSAIIRRSPIDRDLLLTWEGPVVAARLAEPLSEEAHSIMHHAWQATRSASPTPLAISLQLIDP